MSSHCSTQHVIIQSCFYQHYYQSYFKMQEKKAQKPMQLTEYANSLIVDMKSLSNMLKPISKNLYESNNRLLNELLLSNDSQIFAMIIKILMHTLQIVQYKALVTNVLAILNKTIICIKTTQNVDLSSAQKQSLKVILNSTVDILIAATSQNRQVQETALRVLQTTFSLIDHSLIKFYSISMITRLLSICFQFCNGQSILQNISVSALCAFVEALFQFGGLNESFEILNSFLGCLLSSKKYIWIKAKEIKGLIWDLIIICVKNFNANHIIALDHHKQTLELILKMYDISMESIFLKKNKHLYNSPQVNDKQHSKNSNQPQTEDISGVIRFFKAYVYFSISLSIQSYRVVDREYVPFRSTIPKLVIVCDLQRNSRMFIFLQAICLLLLNQYDMPLSLDKGVVFMEILSKIGQELCWCNETGIKVNWDNNQNYLDKVIGEQPKITDGDFVRLLKNTIIQLRVKFEKDDDLIKSKSIKRIQKQSSRQLINLPENLRNSKKWEIFMKNVIRVIRYLSSLNFVNDENQQDPTRKIILQLQYWFLLCPASKAKNLVLQQLLITANVLNNRMQAIKVSQSVQIGTNILYGYYEDLDNMGLTIILKMMAGVKADWQDGKSFQELDQIYNLCKDIFSQEKLIRNQSNFIMTIQALVQCISSLIADIQQPKQKSQTNQNNQNSLKRSHKMIDFLIQRLIVVVKNNLTLAATHWNFITGFLITLCINKNNKIKEQGIKAIGSIVSSLLKAELGEEIDSKKQLEVLGLYEQLAKSKIQVKQTELMFLDQLKMILPRIKQQPALLDGFRIVKILSETQGKTNDVIASIHQLQQILIKQCLFRITETKYLRMILQGFQTKSSEKNQQYRVINLLWSVADYFRIITPKQNIPSEYLEIWEVLFKSFWTVCQSTKECQTKQAAIHSLTQILAETLSLLPFDFVILTISKYYHQMVLLLLGIHASSIIDSEKSPQTAKVALKNYIKLFKKLISIQNKSEEDKKEIAHNISQINNSITKFIRNHVENKNWGSINLEFLYQLSSFICSMSDDKGFQEYGVRKNLREMFNSIEDLIVMCEQKEKSGQTNQKMDLKSHMFKKKLKPLLDKIKEAQEKQKKEELVVESKQ